MASHSDQLDVYVWDFDKQQCMQTKHAQETSTPNIILKGHKSEPTYALAWGTTKTIIASGGQNGDILIWDL